MSYSPSHSRSKSYAYNGQKLPPPPTDAEISPVDYHVPHSSLYRRHSRKKSSQILVEPIGAPKTNYMPISPTITVPPALQTIFDHNDEKRRSEANALPTYGGLSSSPENLHYQQDLQEIGFLKRSSSSAASSTYSPSILSPGDQSPAYIHRRSHTISHRSRVPVINEKAAFDVPPLPSFPPLHTLPSLPAMSAIPPVPVIPIEYSDRRQSLKSVSSSSETEEKKACTTDSEQESVSVSKSRSSSGASLDTRKRSPSYASDKSAPITVPSSPDLKTQNTAEAYSANTLASGASFLIAGQFFAKLLTFTLNQLILKFVGPETFGVNAQLELLITTILFFSREAIRLATQRQSLTGKQPDLYRFEGGVVENTQSGTIQQVINIGFIPLLVGVPLASLLSYLYLYFSGTGSQVDPRTLSLAVIIFALSSVLELLAEPSFLLFQLQLQFRKRASYESIAIFSRCVLTIAFIMFGRQRDIAIVAFALGQLGYSSVLATLYVFNAMRDSRMKPYQMAYPQGVWREGDSSSKVYFARETKTLATSIWLQTVFKHCLTEGDKFLISILLPISEQGVYAIVVNYGSLIARLVFLPIEEALRNFFSKIMAAPVSQDNLKLSVTVLSTLLRVYIYLSIFAVAFGPAVSAYVLQFLVSKSWLNTDAPLVLATYACYIPFLAINGTLEGFVQSVATPSDIKRQSSALFAFSLTFAAAAYVFMRPLGRGAQGLVLANMFNMAQRIGWCVMWIEEYYSRVRAANNSQQEEEEEEEEKDSQTSSSSNSSASTASTHTVYYDKPWGWLALACPRPLVFGAVAGLAPTVWILGQVTSFKGLIQHVCLACILLIAVCFSEKDLLLEGLAKYQSKIRISREDKEK